MYSNCSLCIQTVICVLGLRPEYLQFIFSVLFLQQEKLSDQERIAKLEKECQNLKQTIKTKEADIQRLQSLIDSKVIIDSTILSPGAPAICDINDMCSLAALTRFSLILLIF